MTTSGQLVIRAMLDNDASDVLEIYGEGIATGHATFQTVVPDWETWSGEHLSNCRLVAEMDEKVVGWAALSEVSSRCVYRGIAELGVYVRNSARGVRVGQQLLNALVAESEKDGIWTLQAGIFPENHASLHCHRKAGFRVIGTHEALGFMEFGPMAGQWRDVVLMERRSRIVSRVGDQTQGEK